MMIVRWHSLQGTIFRTSCWCVELFFKHDGDSFGKIQVSIVGHEHYLHKKKFSYINSSSTRTSEQDFACSFGISQSTVSRIIIASINV